MNKLFVDCKTDQEKYDFFLSGRAHETGVIAASLQNDVAMSYQRCINFQSELRRLNEVNQELLWALKNMVLEFNFGDINQGEKFAIDKAQAAIAKAEVAK